MSKAAGLLHHCHASKDPKERAPEGPSGRGKCCQVAFRRQHKLLYGSSAWLVTRGLVQPPSEHLRRRLMNKTSIDHIFFSTLHSLPRISSSRASEHYGQIYHPPNTPSTPITALRSSTSNSQSRRPDFPSPPEYSPTSGSPTPPPSAPAWPLHYHRHSRFGSHYPSADSHP